MKSISFRTLFLMQVAMVFLLGISRAETVNLNWTGSFQVQNDNPPSWSTSFYALGITNGTPFTLSLSYDSTAQALFSSAFDGGGSSYFQGISLNFSVDGKLQYQNITPIIELNANATTWTFHPLTSIDPLNLYSPTNLADNSGNQTIFTMDGESHLGIRNDFNTNSYTVNSIGLTFDHLPTASQLQQVLNTIVQTYGGYADPAEIGVNTLQVHSIGYDFWPPLRLISSGDSDNLAVTTSGVPEPSTYALFGIGAAGMLLVMRRKKTA